MGQVYSVTVPVPGSSRPMAPVTPCSVNHRAPSGPVAMSTGSLSAVKPGTTPATYSVTLPPVVMRPIAPGLPCSVNHSAPSGPVVMPPGVPAVSPPNSVTDAGAAAGNAPAATTRAITGRVRPMREVMAYVRPPGRAP